MWTIAICDDNRRQCWELGVMLKIYSEERNLAVETETFHDGGTLVEKMKKGKHYDIIFLDVLLRGMNGIELGSEIRRRLDNEEVHLVYVSMTTSHLELLFQNRPLGFIKKSVPREEVYRLTDYARQLEVRFQKSFLYRKERTLYQVAYQEICYFQSVGRKIEIHTTDGVYEFYGKLSSILKEGLPGQFIQIHKSYIINRDYVARQSPKRIYMKNENGYLSVSRPYRQSVLGWMADI